MRCTKIFSNNEQKSLGVTIHHTSQIEGRVWKAQTLTVMKVKSCSAPPHLTILTPNGKFLQSIFLFSEAYQDLPDQIQLGNPTRKQQWKEARSTFAKDHEPAQLNIRSSERHLIQSIEVASWEQRREAMLALQTNMWTHCCALRKEMPFEKDLTMLK